MHMYIDQETGEWVLEVGGPGNPIVRTVTLETMEAVLDYMHNVAAAVGKQAG